MEVKILEIRDAATFIPAMATRLHVRNTDELFLCRRAGYSQEQLTELYHYAPYIILCKLDGVEAQYDPYNWPCGRTMQIAHQWIIEHWDEICSGQVIDVEFILGERSEPKKSESVSVP